MTPPFARGRPAGPRIRPGVRCCVPTLWRGVGDQPTSRYPRHVHVFIFESLVMTLAFYALMAVKVWAFVDALIRPAAGYVAAEKLTKPAWLLILGLTVVTALVWPSVIGLLSIVGIVAAFVYLLDVRPALASVTRRR